jgi:hypothetical protein
MPDRRGDDSLDVLLALGLIERGRELVDETANAREVDAPPVLRTVAALDRAIDTHIAEAQLAA